ncbi:hypothetical protein EGR_10604 [Echinococcus granulosus]|uniref:Uncharacterized protein n=1 Tax=Echinococcus granulosus TaxID=6210 RepID=W6U1Y3_ECHGR|nr:hypothetical protein EGR_10604 [Echinococcus granulosus]EUB54536.1 hypothetical protein EGR_10604 [Echinococcus granulosus]
MCLGRPVRNNVNRYINFQVIETDPFNALLLSVLEENKKLLLILIKNAKMEQRCLFRETVESVLLFRMLKLYNESCHISCTTTSTAIMINSCAANFQHCLSLSNSPRLCRVGNHPPKLSSPMQFDIWIASTDFIAYSSGAFLINLLLFINWARWIPKSTFSNCVLFKTSIYSPENMDSLIFGPFYRSTFFGCRKFFDLWIQLRSETNSNSTDFSQESNYGIKIKREILVKYTVPNASGEINLHLTDFPPLPLEQRNSDTKLCESSKVSNNFLISAEYKKQEEVLRRGFFVYAMTTPSLESMDTLSIAAQSDVIKFKTLKAKFLNFTLTMMLAVIKGIRKSGKVNADCSKQNTDNRNRLKFLLTLTDISQIIFCLVQSQLNGVVTSLFQA